MPFSNLSILFMQKVSHSLPDFTVLHCYLGSNLISILVTILFYILSSKYQIITSPFLFKNLSKSKCKVILNIFINRHKLSSVQCIDLYFIKKSNWNIDYIEPRDTSETNMSQLCYRIFNTNSVKHLEWGEYGAFTHYKNIVRNRRFYQ